MIFGCSTRTTSKPQQSTHSFLQSEARRNHVVACLKNMEPLILGIGLLECFVLDLPFWFLLHFETNHDQTIFSEIISCIQSKWIWKDSRPRINKPWLSLGEVTTQNWDEQWTIMIWMIQSFLQFFGNPVLFPLVGSWWITIEIGTPYLNWRY